MRDAVGLHSQPSGQLSVEELHAMLNAIAEDPQRNYQSCPSSASRRESFMRAEDKWPLPGICLKEQIYRRFTRW